MTRAAFAITSRITSLVVAPSARRDGQTRPDVGAATGKLQRPI
jgi:hypothetical protein